LTILIIIIIAILMIILYIQKINILSNFNRNYFLQTITIICNFIFYYLKNFKY
jgi:hypothetical protein